MDPLTIGLIAVGLLLAVVGGIVLLIAAFQESVWWGLASLFLPFASLIFVICHWSRARTGFLLSLVGSALLIGAVVKAAPQLRETITKAAAGQLPAMAQAAEAEDLTAQIQQRREKLEPLEAQFQQDGVALAKRFEALNARRTTLKADDAAAVAQFNAEAATYQAQNAARKMARQEIDTLRKELETLLDERARQGATASAAGEKRVVMFTTATCPACTAAKSYFARKGVKYEERDVNTSPEARTEFQKLGGRGVPLILVGNEKLEGFSAARLEKML